MRFLDLLRNTLANLPAQIGRLSNLDTLLLMGNGLASLPPETGRLKTFYLFWAAMKREGAAMAWLMWKCISPRNRWFLGIGVLCGSISAVLDIISRYMLIKDLCKVTGELMVLMCLLGEAVVTPERERSIKHGG